LEVFGDFGGEDGGGWEVVGVGEVVVAEPEDVEADLVAGQQFVVGEALEAFGGLAAAGFSGAVAGHEVVEVGAAEGVLFAGSVTVAL